MPIYEYNCEHCSYKFDKLVMSHNSDALWKSLVADHGRHEMAEERRHSVEQRDLFLVEPLEQSSWRFPLNVERMQ